MMNKSHINHNVFFGSLTIIILVTSLSCVFPTSLKNIFEFLQNWLCAKTGWLYVTSVGIILLLALWLVCGRFGDIKLGPDHSEPEFKNLSWFSMLFSAGMGIGLMFWGVAEPIMHFTSPPVGEPFTIDTAKEAMKITFFHWGIHVWAIYGILAVTMAYFCYRKDLPLLPRSAFYPIFGEKIHGIYGDLIDIFAILGTMFGVATSLGIGVTQLNAGLAYLFGFPQNISIQVILIICITSFATLSVVFGLEKGIKRLSNINVAMAVILMGCILLLGNTIELLQDFVQNTGAYFSDLIFKTFNLYAYERKDSWIGGWTLFYWGWWISWSPFVGMFIARISKGR
ncbi:MAG: BCCT family transporter, partial [Legionellales bacterium]|nr:BCCT family transporter [Legionellales bacterium]